MKRARPNADTIPGALGRAGLRQVGTHGKAGAGPAEPKKEERQKAESERQREGDLGTGNRHHRVPAEEPREPDVRPMNDRKKKKKKGRRFRAERLLERAREIEGPKGMNERVGGEETGRDIAKS